ncbi:hypothetical protein [Candidatus Oscillochloris fontis]|uniref:hypothetical protein n=1 Tax=Candidatus Oscillochloris fontis TaxID=2496868 RepID=UPI00101D6722|nr:hypothetical protein [Candidatus Oscillochloris fontis]
MGAGTINQRAHPPTPRSFLSIAHLIIGTALLTLAILNPLLCMFHCARAHYLHSRMQPQRIFLCDLRGDPLPTAAPLAQVWGGPRAIYEAVPSVCLTLILITLVSQIFHRFQMQVAQHIVGPTSPPPKLLQSA